MEAFEEKCTILNSGTLIAGKNRYLTLGDIANIGNGMVSGLDKAFQIPSEVELTKEEKKSILKVLKAKNIERYTHGDFHRYIFLNGEVKNEDDLKEKYPTFYSLLNQFKDKLGKRYNYNRKINYWDWVFLRSFNLFNQPQERIFVPCKERISHKDYFRFSYVDSGVFPTQDVTAIFLKPHTEVSVYYILALLNSEYTFEWLKHKGVVKGNIVEFSEKPLASIPIRPINWKNKRDVALHDEITDLCKNYIQTRDIGVLSSLNNRVTSLF
jgi:adenine-specific DNA-methyltransferase